MPILKTHQKEKDKKTKKQKAIGRKKPRSKTKCKSTKRLNGGSLDDKKNYAFINFKGDTILAGHGNFRDFEKSFLSLKYPNETVLFEFGGLEHQNKRKRIWLLGENPIKVLFLINSTGLGINANISNASTGYDGSYPYL